MGDRIGAMDRFSELPDYIIHHIMSYLSTDEAAQTCVLSKRWNHLRASFPILDFDQIYFVGKDLATRHPDFFSIREKRRFCKLINQFIQFVDASLLRFCKLKVSMQKFRLSMTLLDVEGDTSLLDNWIELAVANEVKEFDFNVHTDQTIDDMVYSLPETIFSAKFLTNLKLSGCNWEQSSNTIMFHSLKKLALDNVSMDEQMVQKFISECPLLEDFFISPAWNFKRFCVSHAPKLKIVTIDGSFYTVESIEIVAPSLQQCTLIHLGNTCDSLTLDEFRKRSPSLPRDVENLIIDVQKVPPSKYAAYLDCLLWICFPRVLCIEAKQRKTSIKFIEVSAPEKFVGCS
ncbi:hypothetical protein Ddye_014635 [Dipteronia dyeriana]|uniref:F-box domain-containing protein n=1 Tax=Dipteronia dyeriana TaxID=168575 RepID=A0AAD9X8J4_9ROSI|nr:hypothetical protein Ddye_014635 [Dipteronia dyeriana]